MSYATTLELSLIQSCSNLDYIPSNASLITNNADHPRKSKKDIQVSKSSKNVCSSNEQSHLASKSEEYHVNQCEMYKDKDETSKWECQANVVSMEDDKNHQSTLSSDKTCPDTKFIHMQQVQPTMKRASPMWLAKSATLQSDYKKKKSVCDDKNCQSTQCILMWTAMKSSHMQSVTKPSHMQLPIPAIKQSTYKKFNQDEKNCHSTKKHSSEECPVRPLYNDKKCQSAKCRHMQKSAMPQCNCKKWTHPTQLCRKQIGTQPEVIGTVKIPQASDVTHLGIQMCVQM